MKKVGVIGCGFMGGGIAQVCAAAGHDVLCHDVSPELMERCKSAIAESFDRRIAKGKATTEAKQQVLDRIRYTEEPAGLEDREVILEAVYESLPVKVELFQRLAGVVPEHCLFVSNTSGLCITEMARQTDRPDRMMGAHFFSPVPVMKLVELIRGEQTSDETYEVVRALIASLGKVIVDAPDAPGFIVNLLLAVIMNEASRSLELGVSPEDLDDVLKLGLGMPLGALGLADLSGLDVALPSSKNIYQGLGVEDFAVPRMLQRLYDFGHYGVKTGRGYFQYPR